ncbi:DUF6207 family protein [Streptomyces sp. NBC_01431]|uniref:DUF6207 family protein n=1 Tax=Streptomyces sp. NBC_01431 TaxID=2903863 RepID=UPI002E306CFB|nr:DUF6207 family protein [Streptomyces sp. NBC_01431]
MYDSPSARTTTTPSEPGVRLRCNLDLRQERTSAADPADHARSASGPSKPSGPCPVERTGR